MATTFKYTKEANIRRLSREIRESSITIALDSVDLEGVDQLTVIFKADLPAGDETVLNTLVTNHVDKKPRDDPRPVLVHEINANTGEPEAVQFAISEGRSRVLASTKPVVPGKLLYFYWSGSDDDIDTDPLENLVGEGRRVRIDVDATDTRKSLDLHYGNYKHGELVYLAGGAFQWEGTNWGDEISLYVMADKTPTQQVSNLDYELDGDRIKLATGGTGTGTHGLGGTPVFVPNYQKKGYWNLTPELTAEPAAETGAYDWWTIKKEAGQFVEKLPLFGTETKGLQLQAPETANLPAGYFLRVVCKNGSGGAWKLAGSVMFFREKVGNP